MRRRRRRVGEQRIERERDLFADPRKTKQTDTLYKTPFLLTNNLRSRGDSGSDVAVQAPGVGGTAPGAVGGRRAKRREEEEEDGEGGRRMEEAEEEGEGVRGVEGVGRRSGDGGGGGGGPGAGDPGGGGPGGGDGGVVGRM